MKKTLLSLVAFALTATGLAAASGPGLLVPAYFTPGADSLWAKLNAAAEKNVPLIAIMNPDVGPGAKPNPDYIQATRELQKSGGKVVGYVYTKYGKRNPGHVMEDITRYFEWYPHIDGIFVDQMPADLSEQKKEPSRFKEEFTKIGGNTKPIDRKKETSQYYYGVWVHIKALNSDWMVIGNPGATPDQSFYKEKTADTFVTFANYDGYDAYKPPSWLKRGSRETAHLIYDVTSAEDMKKHIAAAREHGANWVYVTDDGGGNPWDTLPAYWDEEVAQFTSGGSSSGSPSETKKKSGFFRKK